MPLTPNVPHLLRLSFVKPNFTGFRGFNYSVETQDMLYLEKVVFDFRLIFRSENILVSADKVVHICLIRTSESDDPFISAIALRPLLRGMYDTAKPGIMLHNEVRCDLGSKGMTRYPLDPFDRLWDPCNYSGSTLDVLITETKSVNVSKPISVSNTKNFPPSNVMQTAVINDTSSSINISLVRGSLSGKALAVLYFAELNSTAKRSFSVGMYDVIRINEIDLVGNASAIELPFQYHTILYPEVELQSKISGVSPIINALEIFSLFSTQPLISSNDATVKALRELRKAYSLNKWTSDPCFGLPWEGILCSNISNTVRISQINLSGRLLRGPIPPSFGELTEVVSMSLNNNYFEGTFPNLTRLFKLEILCLQNNNLSGKIPVWLSKLPRLRELNIANNNFKGAVPQQLLKKSSLTFDFRGNKQLCRTEHECRDHSSSSSRVAVALGVTGGVIVIAILMGIVLYRRKLKSPSAKPSPDFLMVNVTNSSKSRAFTLEEMTTATGNFNCEIGRGSFGSVFLGKLQDGKQIAVKVLTIFSTHGVAQFLNEIDLLSRINHKKLVSFLGYCNESRDLMLVYEYMSGGSLSDNLYDPQATKYPQLDWKTRLKIALDAAQGLEYLHVGCTPKIIHRDVKTSNILLDSNCNGKLADFGLSRVTSNEDGSQINTAIKGTPGYLDPMYFKTQMLTDKSDVYSFGVVLLELICGRKPIDAKVSADKVLLTEWVASYSGVDKDAANIEEIVDKRLGKRYNMKSIVDLTNLGWRCIASEPSVRPAISEVVAEIKEALTFEEEYRQVPDELSFPSTSIFPTSP